MIVFVLISLSCTSAANNQTADIVAQDIDLVTDEILTDGNNEAGDFSELDDEIANATSKTLELKKN